MRAYRTKNLLKYLKSAWRKIAFKFKQRRSKRKERNKHTRWRRLIVWSERLLILMILMDSVYLAYLWPDWKLYARGTLSETAFVRDYQMQRKRDKSLSSLRWKWIAMKNIPNHVRRAAIVAEDARFYTHNGIDFLALKEAVDYNFEHGKLKYGASTISQQTVKNIFLSPSRNPLRKWHELILTLGMEMNLHKMRILEIYLNVAEFGQGIYGVEAAAQAYWGISANALTEFQAAQLAASLPSPKRHNPKTLTRRFNRRALKIFRLMSGTV